MSIALHPLLAVFANQVVDMPTSRLEPSVSTVWTYCNARGDISFLPVFLQFLALSFQELSPISDLKSQGGLLEIKSWVWQEG